MHGFVFGHVLEVADDLGAGLGSAEDGQLAFIDAHCACFASVIHTDHFVQAALDDAVAGKISGAHLSG
ncbi:hypothetical protein NBRC116588_09590 [Pyruvatibacter sp. HU-CL02332]